MNASKRPATATAPPSPAALVRLLLLAAMWGASFLFIKVALEGVSPVQLVFARLATGGAVLAALVALRRERLPRDAGTWGWLLAMAAIGNIVPFFLFAWGEQRIDSALAGIYNATTPLITMTLAIVAFRHESATPQRVAGLILGFLGVLTVIGPWRGIAGSSLSGQLACLGAGACYGVAFNIARRYLSGRGHSPLALAAATVNVAALLVVVLLPFLGGGSVELTPPVVGSLLALGAFGTGIAFILNYGLIDELGATRASTVTYLIPLFAVVLGVLVLGEEVRWHHGVGGAVVLAGMALAEGRVVHPRGGVLTPAVEEQ